MKSIEDAEKLVDEARAGLAQAEETLRLTKNAALGAISTGNCPECGSLIRLGNLPTSKGRQTNPTDCEGCNRRYDVIMEYDGGDKYAPASYHTSFVHRGFITDLLPADKLTGEQIENEKQYLASLGEGKVPAQIARERELVFEQVRRQDAGKIDRVLEQNASIIDLLKKRLGV